ncbi:MAG: hypothetical protein Q4D44_06635 [Eubacteriales bacterium]|nr:hypothetical protein [Eubacteriales bacterium]
MKYVAPEMKIVMFEAEEVIAASGAVVTTTTTTEPEMAGGDEI